MAACQPAALRWKTDFLLLQARERVIPATLDPSAIHDGDKVALIGENCNTRHTCDWRKACWKGLTGLCPLCTKLSSSCRRSLMLTASHDLQA